MTISEIKTKDKRGTPRNEFERFLNHHRLNAYYQGCCICGWKRSVIDYCHIIPHAKGGDYSINNLVPLCPNHHRLLDRELLEEYESEAITRFIYNIYDCLEKGLMYEFLDNKTS